jgi:hypothetical protein
LGGRARVGQRGKQQGYSGRNKRSAPQFQFLQIKFFGLILSPWLTSLRKPTLGDLP